MRLSPYEYKMRLKRKKHLKPLTEMTVGAIIEHINQLKANSAYVLLQAMDSCTQSNCSWVEYQIAIRFRVDVVKRIQRKKNGRKATG